LTDNRTLLRRLYKENYVHVFTKSHIMNNIHPRLKNVQLLKKHAHLIAVNNKTILDTTANIWSKQLFIEIILMYCLFKTKGLD